MTRHVTRHDVANGAPVKLIIAARLRDAQSEKDITNEELARQTGISLRLVQKHRAGHNAPGDQSLRLYASVLGKPLSFFFTGAPLSKEVAA